jgi:hypothetical protein
MASWTRMMGASQGGMTLRINQPEPNRAGQMVEGTGARCAPGCECDEETSFTGPTPPGSSGVQPTFYNYTEIIHS